MSNEYKSLRSIIFEVQATAAPKPKPAAPVQPSATGTKPKEEHKKGEVWKTASGHYGARNPAGVTDYFDDQERAKAYSKGAGRGGSVDHGAVDKSREVALDQDGYAKDAAADQKPVQKGAVQPNAGKPAAQPAAGTGQPTQKAQAVPADTQRQAQPQGSQAGAAQAKVEPEAKDEHPEVARENPATEFDSEFKEDPKATAQAKTKRDMRKSNIVAAAIKAKKFVGPRDNKESVFGDPRKERAFIEELNHAALSAMRGDKAYDFELCSQAFADVGFCFDPKTKSGVSKGIPRDRMPQFSSQVDPSRTDTPAFKALMAGKGYTSPDQVKPEDLKSEVNMEKQYREALEAAGYTIEEQEVPVTSLKPIQGQLKGEKVAGMYGTLLAAQEDETYAKQAARLLEPIYVSDGYVIDGHHRWAAQCAVDIANGGGANTTMKTRTITKGGKPVPVDEIINFSNKFQKDIGLLSQTRGGETIPEKKPEAKNEKPKTEGFGMFGNSRNRLVESLLEAVKVKRDRNPQLGTINYGVDQDDPNRFVDALKPLKPRKTDARGNLLTTKKPISKQKSKAIANDANTAVKMATQLISEIDAHPAGTSFEIYGKKNGNDYTLKLKKIRKMGTDAYETASGRVVVLNAAGTGLQVLDKKTRKIVLDRGNDYIWES